MIFKEMLGSFERGFAKTSWSPQRVWSGKDRGRIEKNMSSKCPLVSVIIPTYNSAQYITEAIESVLDQTYKDFEIIVVDDGSTDNTKDILEPYIRERMVQYVYQDNQGVAAARNTGIGISNGEFVSFLDADDILDRGSIRNRLDALHSYRGKADCVLADCIFFYDNAMKRLQDKQTLWQKRGIFEKLPKTTILEENGQTMLLNNDLYRTLIRECYFRVQSLLMSRKAFMETGGFDETLGFQEDWDFFLRCSKLKNIVILKKPLAYIRRGTASLSTHSDIVFSFAMVVLEKLLKNETDQNIIKFIRKRIGLNSFMLGYWHYKRKERWHVLECFYKSVRYGFYDIKMPFYVLALALPENVLGNIRKITRKFIKNLVNEKTY